VGRAKSRTPSPAPESSANIQYFSFFDIIHKLSLFPSPQIEHNLLNINPDMRRLHMTPLKEQFQKDLTLEEFPRRGIMPILAL